MSGVEISEAFAPGMALREAKVDRRSNLIQNVALLGRTSLNNRVYTDKAMRDAVRLYEGARFFIDHPRKSDMKDRQGIRSVFDLAGKVRRPRLVGEQVRGDLEILDAEPTKSVVFALAEQMPELVGNSHRARGKVSVNREGQQVVEGLEEVMGVELVTEPATVAGLLESVGGWGGEREEEETMGKTKQFSEAELEEIRDRLFGRPGTRTSTRPYKEEELAEVHARLLGLPKPADESDIEGVHDRLLGLGGWSAWSKRTEP